MTNREAVEAEIGISGYEQNSVTKALADNNLTANADYVPGSQDVLKAALQVLKIMLAMSSVSEGGFSISYAIKDRIKTLEDQLGLIDTYQPKIKDISWMW